MLESLENIYLPKNKKLLDLEQLEKERLGLKARGRYNTEIKSADEDKKLAFELVKQQYSNKI